MATIEKRGPYQWRARVRVKGQKSVSKTFTTRKDAEAWARMTESEMERNIYISRAEAEKATLMELIERFEVEYIPTFSHPNKEISRLKHLKDSNLAHLSMSSIRAVNIHDYIQERQKEVSNKTISLELSLLSRIFNIAKSNWGMESLQNPVSYVSKPKLSKGRDRRLKDHEEEKLMGAGSLSLKPVISFALETAMRREEIASLSWEDINMEKRIAYLAKTKNGESRTVPLSDKAINILKHSQPPKVVPISGKVFGLKADSISQSFKRACRKAKIDNLRFHDLRHEATSRFFEETDLDVMEIKSITGHKTLQMLLRYTHLRADKLANRLGGARRGEK